MNADAVRARRLDDHGLVLRGRVHSAEGRDWPVSARELLPLCARHTLSAYDAAYLDLALRKSLPLATLDKRLIAAAKESGVQLLGI